LSAIAPLAILFSGEVSWLEVIGFYQNPIQDLFFPQYQAIGQN
jgi:hypothetical protein